MTFAPEHRLIVCCARLHLTDNDRAALRKLAGSDLDWDRLVAETLRQCLVPLVYRHLQAHCAELVPPAILDILRDRYLLASARSMALAAELREITLLLEAGGVPSLPYKGPVLALQAYGDIALRTFTDLDLIVRPADVGKARALLATRGFHPLDEMTPSQEAAVLRLDHNLPLVRAADDLVVELHWRVAPAAVTFPMPMELLWQRTGPVLLGGTEVRGMSPSDLILVLTIHGTRHGWSAVEWITGIAELIRQGEGINWEQVLTEAEAYRAARSVRLALALCDRLLDAPLPARVSQWIDQDRRIPQLVAWVAERLFVPSDSSSAAQQWAAFKFELAIKDGVRDRIRDGGYRLFQPSAQDWSAAGLPDRLFALYHLLRPFRLLARYLASIARQPGAAAPAGIEGKNGGRGKD